MHSQLNIERIKELAVSDKIVFKKHTVLRMYQRRISADEVKHALETCTLVENYPEDYPLPSGLVLGRTKNNRAIHAVVALEENQELLWVITVYEPNLIEWEEGFEKRRR